MGLTADKIVQKKRSVNVKAIKTLQNEIQRAKLLK